MDGNEIPVQEKQLAQTANAKASSGSPMKVIMAAAIIILALVVVAALLLMTPKVPTKVLLQTSMGNVTLELYSDMPITAGNFEKLVNQGFYDGVIFHRVIGGFMIQGGDPTGTGAGDPGYKIQDEFTDHNRNDRATISMANAGPNTGGSQFFINLVNNNFLDTKHPVFGRVVAGMDVVDAIGAVQTDADDKPLTDVTIIKATAV